MSLSFAVTAYKETTRGGPGILECLAPAIEHSAITEIVVVDDFSGDFEALTDLLKDVPKLKLYENPHNYGVFGNKLAAVSHSTGDWVMNCDSDNLVSQQFIDIVMGKMTDSHTWICPSFARPEFDYRAYVGRHDLSNVAQLIEGGGLAHCLLNTGNQTVNREAYLNVFGRYLDQRADLMMPNHMDLSEAKRKELYWRRVFDATDSIIFNSEWIKSGGTLEVVADLEYDHFWTGGPDSNYNRAPAEKGILNEFILKNLQSFG